MRSILNRPFLRLYLPGKVLANFTARSIQALTCSASSTPSGATSTQPFIDRHCITVSPSSLVRMDAHAKTTLSPLGKHITKLIFTILSGVAEMQLAMIRERTSKAMRQYQAHGRRIIIHIRDGLQPEQEQPHN